MSTHIDEANLKLKRAYEPAAADDLSLIHI